MRANVVRVVVLHVALLFAACDNPVVPPLDGSVKPDATTDAGSCSDASRIKCGDQCLDLRSDPMNCGKCGVTCSKSMVCSNGMCETDCAEGEMVCAGQCVSPRSDSHHCGACDHVCENGQVCTDGTCAVACSESETRCTAADGTARCADLKRDAHDCGACGTACAVGQTCSDGSCKLSCGSGKSLCDSTCLDTSADPGHCGACNHACESGQRCSQGACVARCETGLTDCDGACIDISTSAEHCGACAHACALANAAASTCVAGSCTVAGCNAHYGDCNADPSDGCELDTASDVQHCGACDVSCAFAHGTSACLTGTCVLSACLPGFADCDNDASNGCETNTGAENVNCGECGLVCAPGTVCSLGTCEITCGDGLTDCGTGCVSLTSDEDNCGSCTLACSLPHVRIDACAASSCVVGPCDLGYGDCDGDADNGCETNVRSVNVHNCGGCGIQCAYRNAGALCASGYCAMGSCHLGFADCDDNPSNGCEINLQADQANCGRCSVSGSHACASGDVCSHGECAASCGVGTTDCSGDCVDTRNDPGNCGTCDHACALAHATGVACISGNCAVSTCAPSYSDCNATGADGCETITRGSDVQNCGGCGLQCSYPNAGAACTSGSCAMASCNTGFADCDASSVTGCEVNLKTDNANCGACEHACEDGKVCSAGACAATCGEGTTECSGDCVNTRSDPNHCGGCGEECALPHTSSAACVAGSCAPSTCATGYKDCDGVASNGCETAVNSTDVHNCGGCGIECAFANAQVACTAGVCELASCNSGYEDCNSTAADGCEINAQTDNAHCGQCSFAGSHVCVSGKVCSLGTCTPSCGAGTTECSGDCVNTQNDPNNCGDCGSVCALAHVAANACASGDCVVSACSPGYKDCDGIAANGCETNTQGSDVSNCGGCGITCAYANAGASCSAGSCSMGSCNSNYANCDGSASNGCEVNTRTDNANCGMCSVSGSHVCADGDVCTVGSCAPSCGVGTTECSGDCVNTQNDPNNCGGCSSACAPAHASVAACTSGACAVVACSAGYADCDHAGPNGCELNIGGTDLNNCGACALHCSFPNAAASCTAGSCTMGSCNAGFADCDNNPANGCEINIKVDGGNCGACAQACSDGTVCSNSQCKASCGSGLTDCSGSCFDLAHDPSHCGGCATACAARANMVSLCGGAPAGCFYQCLSGYADCNNNASDGCEVQTTNSVSHCGSCGHACANESHAATVCSSGSCSMPACDSGYLDCNANLGTAADGCEVMGSYCQSLFFENFSGMSQAGAGTQCSTGNVVYAFASIPSWTVSGVNAMHGVVWAAPGNIAAQFYNGSSAANTNAMTSQAIAANTNGVQYSLRFLGGPGCWSGCSQGSTAGASLLFEILRTNGTQLQTYTYHPPVWNNQQVMAADRFTYTGDGSGDIKIRISGTGDRGVFGGAVDDIRVTIP